MTSPLVFILGAVALMTVIGFVLASVCGTTRGEKLFGQWWGAIGFFVTVVLFLMSLTPSVKVDETSFPVEIIKGKYALFIECPQYSAISRDYSLLGGSGVVAKRTTFTNAWGLNKREEWELGVLFNDQDNQNTTSAER